MLIYVTDQFYNPKDEGRIAYNHSGINYDWETQHKWKPHMSKFLVFPVQGRADLLTWSYFLTHKLPLVIARESYDYGPYQFLDELIPL
jgi:hypothetical protein